MERRDRESSRRRRLPEETTLPPVSWITSDEEVVLHVRGFAVLRALYEAEGYYDEAADGDPEEQELYLIELLDAPRASRAAEALDGKAVWPLADLGMCAATLHRLFPAARWTPAAAPPLVAQYLLVLAWAMQDERQPAERQRLLHASAAWSPAAITDAFESLPAGWRQEAAASSQ